jgi:hypothetical protein
MAWLVGVLDVHPLPGGVIPYTGESGRVSYCAGDLYRFGITAVGGECALLDRLDTGLHRVGAARRASGGPVASLQGNFEVVSVVADNGLRWPASSELPSDALTLRFLSPLRMQRPQDDVRPGRRYLDGRSFSASQFLERFRGRLERLAGVLGLSDLPAVPEGVRTAEANLLWVDMPIASRDGDARGRPQGYTLGGVLGSVRIGGLPPPWPQLLALGSVLHAGEKTHYGLGRFVIEEVFDPAADPLRPVQTASMRIADVPLLRASLDHVVTGSTAAGVDGVRPHEASLEAESIVDALRRELAAGAYHPRELLGFLQPKPSGGMRPLAIPTVRDRCVQRAASALLGPAIDTLLEDCSYAYRKGFSRAHAAAAVRRAYEQGFRHVLDADIEGFFDAVEWPRMLAKLRALVPLGTPDRSHQHVAGGAGAVRGAADRAESRVAPRGAHLAFAGEPVP